MVVTHHHVQHFRGVLGCVWSNLSSFYMIIGQNLKNSNFGIFSTKVENSLICIQKAQNWFWHNSEYYKKLFVEGYLQKNSWLQYFYKKHLAGVCSPNVLRWMILEILRKQQPFKIYDNTFLGVLRKCWSKVVFHNLCRAFNFCHREMLTIWESIYLLWRTRWYMIQVTDSSIKRIN